MRGGRFVNSHSRRLTATRPRNAPLDRPCHPSTNAHDDAFWQEPASRLNFISRDVADERLTRAAATIRRFIACRRRAHFMTSGDRRADCY